VTDARPLVLIVDDDRGIRHLLESVLGAAGFDVATAADGREGLRKVRMLEPAALVLDIMMPDLGGLRVLDELTSDPSPVPVVVMTGRADAAAACRDRLGTANVFEKPFITSDVVGRVRELVGSTHGRGGHA
jgi:DNA-binding response OmpR family regulator